MLGSTEVVEQWFRSWKRSPKWIDIFWAHLEREGIKADLWIIALGFWILSALSFLASVLYEHFLRQQDETAPFTCLVSGGKQPRAIIVLEHQSGAPRRNGHQANRTMLSAMTLEHIFLFVSSPCSCPATQLQEGSKQVLLDFYPTDATNWLEKILVQRGKFGKNLNNKARKNLKPFQWKVHN